MAKDLHTVSLVPGTNITNEDRLTVGAIPQRSHAAGGSAGAAVTIAVTGLELPPTYAVQCTPSQDATCWVTARTATGFTVNVAPRLAASTLAAGTVDIIILA